MPGWKPVDDCRHMDHQAVPADHNHWVAVTAVAWSDDPSRIASSTAVQDVRPASSAATKE